MSFIVAPLETNKKNGSTSIVLSRSCNDPVFIQHSFVHSCQKYSKVMKCVFVLSFFHTATAFPFSIQEHVYHTCLLPRIKRIYKFIYNLFQIFFKYFSILWLHAILDSLNIIVLRCRRWLNGLSS